MYSDQKNTFSYGDARNYQQQRHPGYPHDYRNGQPSTNRAEPRSPYGYHQGPAHHPRSPHHYNSQDYRGANGSRLEPRNSYTGHSGGYRAGYAPSGGYRSQHHQHQTHSSSYHNKGMKKNANQSHSQRPGPSSERSRNHEPKKSLVPKEKVKFEDEKKDEVVPNAKHNSELPQVCVSGTEAFSSVEVGTTQISNFSLNGVDSSTEIVSSKDNDIQITASKEFDNNDHCVETEVDLVGEQNKVIPPQEGNLEIDTRFCNSTNDVELIIPKIVVEEVIETEILQEAFETKVDYAAVCESEVNKPVSSEVILTECNKQDEMDNEKLSHTESQVHHVAVEKLADNIDVYEPQGTENIPELREAQMSESVIPDETDNDKPIIESLETQVYHDAVEKQALTTSVYEPDETETIPELCDVLLTENDVPDKTGNEKQADNTEFYESEVMETTELCEVLLNECDIPNETDNDKPSVIESLKTEVYDEAVEKQALSTSVYEPDVTEIIPELCEVVLTESDALDEKSAGKVFEMRDDNSSFSLCLEADNCIEIEISPSEVEIHEASVINNEAPCPSLTESSEPVTSEKQEISEPISYVESVQNPINVEQLPPNVPTKSEVPKEEINKIIHNENDTSTLRKTEQSCGEISEQQMKGSTTPTPTKKVTELDSQKKHLDEITENLDVMYITPGKSSRKSRVLIDSTNIVESSTIQYVVRDVKQKETNDVTPVITPVRRSTRKKEKETNDVTPVITPARRSTRKKAETPGSLKTCQVIQELSPEVLRKAKVVENPFLKTK